MTAPVDSAPFGARAPDFRALGFTITRALPVGWLDAHRHGAAPIGALKDGALDTMVWGLRTRALPPPQ